MVADAMNLLENFNKEQTIHPNNRMADQILPSTNGFCIQPPQPFQQRRLDSVLLECLAKSAKG
jgi:hypothetical protein